MSHPIDDQCIGCKACMRLQETEQVKVDMIHHLVRNMLDLQQLCHAADQIDFDILDELIESTVEDCINEYLAIQPPSTLTHH